MEKVTKVSQGEQTKEDDQLEAAVALACQGPPASVGGTVSEAGERVAIVAQTMKAVVGKLKVAGLGWGQILSVIAQIGFFIAEHGDDIEAIVRAVLALFGKTTPEE